MFKPTRVAERPPTVSGYLDASEPRWEILSVVVVHFARRLLRQRRRRRRRNGRYLCRFSWPALDVRRRYVASVRDSRW